MIFKICLFVSRDVTLQNMMWISVSHNFNFSGDCLVSKEGYIF